MAVLQAATISVNTTSEKHILLLKLCQQRLPIDNQQIKKYS